MRTDEWRSIPLPEGLEWIVWLNDPAIESSVHKKRTGYWVTKCANGWRLRTPGFYEPHGPICEGTLYEACEALANFVWCSDD